MFERGALATGGLPFAELKTRALINAAAKGRRRHTTRFLPAHPYRIARLLSHKPKSSYANANLSFGLTYEVRQAGVMLLDVRGVSRFLKNNSRI